jgi:hypothetical protein
MKTILYESKALFTSLYLKNLCVKCSKSKKNYKKKLPIFIAKILEIIFLITKEDFEK